MRAARTAATPRMGSSRSCSRRHQPGAGRSTTVTRRPPRSGRRIVIDHLMRLQARRTGERDAAAAQMGHRCTLAPRGRACRPPGAVQPPVAGHARGPRERHPCASGVGRAAAQGQARSRSTRPFCTRSRRLGSRMGITEPSVCGGEQIGMRRRRSRSRRAPGCATARAGHALSQGGEPLLEPNAGLRRSSWPDLPLGVLAQLPAPRFAQNPGWRGTATSPKAPRARGPARAG